MDQQQITHVERMLQLFEARISQYDKTTEALIEELAPLLTEFCTVCRATNEETTWLRIDLDMPSLILECAIDYDDPDSIPEFMDILSPVDEDGADADYCYRRMIIVVPLVIAFKDPVEIRDFIKSTIDRAITKKQGQIAATLTVSQQTSAFLHRDTSKGQKH